MLSTPQIVRTAPQLTAMIHLVVPREDIQKVMGESLKDLRDAVAAQGVATTGPWFTHHLKKPKETFDFEICVPVAAEVSHTGRVEAGQLPAATVARTIYHGGYEGLGAAWGEFEAWIAANGHTPAPDLWESYVVGPESESDPAAWRTELNRPLSRSPQ